MRAIIVSVIVVCFLPLAAFAEEDTIVDGSHLAAMVENGDVLRALNEIESIEYEDSSFVTINAARIGDLLQETVAVEKKGTVTDGRSENYSFRMDSAKSVLFIRNEKRALGDYKEIVGKEEIRQKAMRDIQLLGIVDVGNLDILVTRIMRKKKGDLENAKPVLYKVKIRRLISGKKLYGQRLVLSYFLDGGLHKVLYRWPVIEKKMHCTSVLKTDEVVNSIKNGLLNHPISKIPVERVSISVGLKVIDGDIKRVIFVDGKMSNGMGGYTPSRLDITL